MQGLPKVMYSELFSGQLSMPFRPDLKQLLIKQPCPAATSVSVSLLSFITHSFLSNRGLQHVHNYFNFRN